MEWLLDSAYYPISSLSRDNMLSYLQTSILHLGSIILHLGSIIASCYHRFHTRFDIPVHDHMSLSYISISYIPSIYPPHMSLSHTPNFIVTPPPPPPPPHPPPPPPPPPPPFPQNLASTFLSVSCNAHSLLALRLLTLSTCALVNPLASTAALYPTHVLPRTSSSLATSFLPPSARL